MTLSDEEKDRITIRLFRERIDELDAQIAALVNERITFSRGVQEIKLRLGEPRLQLQREQEVLRHYADVLGRAGQQIAHTILAVARGPQR